uniref:Glycosyltransferase n=1 Tax=viral metagenome TaxID=1070528 RepID=A0A6C0JXU0_9ZZZZ
MYIHLGYNQSGLGNQLYVYAAGVVGKIKSGYKLCMVRSAGNPHSDTDYRPMLLQGESVDNSDPNSILIHQHLGQSEKWDDSTIKTDGIHNYYMVGPLYQNYQSIKDVIPIIRNDFKKVFAEKFPGFKETVDSKSAFVHVRRGDYTKAFSKVLPTIKYYKRGIEMLKTAGIENIYLLSDDLKWCKKRLGGLGLTPFEEDDELKTLYLMSLCKGGAVISASTFSSWGAILGPDENKKSVIVYPKKWLQRTNDNNYLDFPFWWHGI